MAEEQWEDRNISEPAQVLEMPPLSPPPSPAQKPVDYSHMIAVISAWKAILNARLLALLALAGALVIYAFAMYDPTNLRLTGASLYSVGVLWPIIALYFRKG